VAGFPDVLSVGTNVKCTIYGLESKNAVVLKHFPEKRSTLVVDKSTRRKHLVGFQKSLFYFDNNVTVALHGIFKTFGDDIESACGVFRIFQIF
jgi:hypothetical protein